MIALLVGVSMFLLVVAVRRPPLTAMVGRYVGPPIDGPPQRARPMLRPPVLVGATVGVVLGPAGPVVGGGMGAAIAWVLDRGRRRSRIRARSRRLGHELPTVADLCALHVLSGDSVTGAMRRFTREATGIAAEEISEILDRVDAGTGLPEAAREVARISAHRDGGRLYEILAQAHRSGARLVDSLEMFAADRRAALEREMTIEGGRRALTGYGPILGLMIPTTLLFLMYPTLAGLDALSTTR